MTDPGYHEPVPVNHAYGPEDLAAETDPHGFAAVRETSPQGFRVIDDQAQTTGWELANPALGVRVSPGVLAPDLPPHPSTWTQAPPRQLVPSHTHDETRRWLSGFALALAVAAMLLAVAAMHARSVPGPAGPRGATGAAGKTDTGRIICVQFDPATGDVSGLSKPTASGRCEDGGMRFRLP